MENATLIVSALVGLSVGSFLIGFRSLRKPASMERRVQMLSRQKPASLRELEMQESFTARVLGPAVGRLLAGAGRVAPKSNAERTRRNLIIAGSPYNLSLLDFMGLRLVSAICLGCLGAVVAGLRQELFPMHLVYAVGAFVVGLYLPNYWLKRRIKGRQKAIIRALPDALDMLTIAVDAGLGFDQAMMRVSEKWDNELTRELQRAINEMRLGVRRTDALRNLVYRTDVSDLASFVAVLVQADRLGVSIAAVLHAQSEQMRMRRRQRAEEEARKAPLKMLFPLVLFIFPSLFVVILGPAVPGLVDAFSNM